MAAGEFLAAHDAALVRLAAGEDSPALRQSAVLALARAGALGSARRLFARLRLGESRDPEIRGLGARLLKDAALSSGRQADAARAARASMALFRETNDGWHGINAAAMLLLAGRPAASARLAGLVAALPDQGDYWSAATQAEAALLTGDTDGTVRALETARARAGGDLAVRAATLRQMRWEVRRLRLDPAVLAPLTMPTVVHFCGRIPGGDANGASQSAAEAPLRAALAPLVAGVGHGFGGLAAGADLVVAEALLAAGSRVTAILPFPPEDYIAASVAPAGEAWVARFRAVLPRCEVLVLGPQPIDDCDFQLASRLAMGRARLAAAALGAPCRQIAVLDGPPAPGVAGTAADVAAWAQAGGEADILPNPWPRRTAAAAASTAAPRVAKPVLFADLRGFGALDDVGLARFYSDVLPRFAEALAVGAPAYRNAWGDALQAVFETPAAAAAAGAAVARAVPASALAAVGLPATLRPRLALDFGALAPVFDAVQGVAKFAGTVMTRAARIEPVTPPGSIYATEAFACEMALDPQARFTCDYAGIVATAKGFGHLPLYALRPASGVASGVPEIAEAEDAEKGEWS